MVSNIIVAVTQRVDSVQGRAELRDALDQRLIRWLVRAGTLPVAVPNNLSCESGADEGTLARWLEAVRPGLLLLSGGNDIGEQPTRDATERYLIAWAAAERVPVLGICRGMQMLAVWAGGELVRKEGHAGVRHALRISGVKEGWPVEVNSYHNWILAGCPAGFEVEALAEDGSIEAIRHAELPWEGWMWHPEREAPFDPKDIRRLKRLINGS